MTLALTDRIALVTGASRGIGHAVALELGRQGAIVAGTATTVSGAAALSETLKNAHLRGSGYALDVNAAAQVESVIAEIERQWVPISILVNNAGITRDNLLMRMKDEDWDVLLDTNLKSVYRLSKRIIRSMLKARFGRIINITSVVGVMGNIGQTNYAAAKAGMIGFSMALAREVGSRNVTVNCVAPGFIATDMTEALNDDQRAALIANIPLARLGTPQDVAGAVAFLASPAAAYVTGITLHVNGGLWMG